MNVSQRGKSHNKSFSTRPVLEGLRVPTSSPLRYIINRSKANTIFLLLTGIASFSSCVITMSKIVYDEFNVTRRASYESNWLDINRDNFKNGTCVQLHIVATEATLFRVCVCQHVHCLIQLSISINRL